MRRVLYTAASAVTAAVLAGCGVGPFGGDEPGVKIEGAWTFDSGRTPDDGELRAPLAEMVTLSFGPDGAGGFAGCNSYGGDFDLDGADLRFESFDQTLMGCNDSRSVFEPVYLDALNDVRHAAREGERLTLTGDDITLEFTVLPAWPEAAVVARTWRLHTILPAGTRPAGDPAVLRLGRNGTVTASDGCQSITGRWAEWRGDVVMTESAMRGTCPADLVEQSGQVQRTLSRFSAAVKGSRELVLTSRGGDIGGDPLQLVYRR